MTFRSENFSNEDWTAGKNGWKGVTLRICVIPSLSLCVCVRERRSDMTGWEVVAGGVSTAEWATTTATYPSAHNNSSTFRFSSAWCVRMIIVVVFSLLFFFCGCFLCFMYFLWFCTFVFSVYTHMKQITVQYIHHTCHRTMMMMMMAATTTATSMKMMESKWSVYESAFAMRVSASIFTSPSRLKFT